MIFNAVEKRDNVALNSAKRCLERMFRVEKMKSKDFPFAVKLANTMNWNMAESDLEFMAKLEPDGCFVLREDDNRVGMATCISYGRIGWFGNLAVKPEYRRKGAGSYLVRHAVQYLNGKGVEAVGLYAYQHLVGFYGKIGFRPDNEFILFSGRPSISKQRESVREATEKDLQRLVKLDEDCLGWNRERLLESVLTQDGNLCYVSARNGEINGFMGAKVYDEMVETGPLVCRQGYGNAALELLTAILERVINVEGYVCVPAKEKRLIEVLVKAGLKENKRLTRMFLGSVVAQSCVYMPESLERG